jgi:4-alpha-glucanotransferase
MRFFRLFWIPDGMDPAQGAYVKDHHEDLVRILALESVRHKVVIVGEDLGTVQPSVREALKRFGILSYRLLYFEKRDDKQFRLPDEYPHQALVSATTHDLPTLAGFWLNRDIEARRNAGILNDDTYHAQLADRAREKQKMLDLLFRLGLLPDWFSRNAAEVHELTGELHNAFVGFLASTRSMLMALNQEDLLKETEQQNLPGTTSEYPNWRRKMKFTVEELRSERPPRDFTAMLRNWLLQSGRTKEAS